MVATKHKFRGPNWATSADRMIMGLMTERQKKSISRQSMEQYHNAPRYRATAPSGVRMPEGTVVNVVAYTRSEAIGRFKRAFGLKRWDFSIPIEPMEKV